MNQYALVNKTTSVVEGVIIWDGVAEWTPPDGMDAIKLLESDVVHVGGTRNPDGTFSLPSYED